ncbi:MAG: DUF1636 domain-containing protein [Caulobacteraceae bacterium]|nr:DUF1636 domain-containing protein [Caulobacteraceae bacterium]
MTDDLAPRPRLAVCVTCKAGQEPAEGELRPGRRLFDALAERCSDADAPVELMAVECLSLCERGCSAAVSLAGKWSYLLGGLDAGKADDLLTYARAYAASKTGLVLPSKRPASLAAMVMGRIPPG